MCAFPASRSTTVRLATGCTNSPCMASATPGTFAKVRFAAEVAKATGERKNVCMPYNIVSNESYPLNPTPLRAGKPCGPTRGLAGFLLTRLRTYRGDGLRRRALRRPTIAFPSVRSCLGPPPSQAPQEHHGGSGRVSRPLDRPDLNPSHWRQRKGSRTSFDPRLYRTIANSRRV